MQMSYYFQFLTALILLKEVQGGLVVPPSPCSAVGDINNENHQVRLIICFYVKRRTIYLCLNITDGHLAQSTQSTGGKSIHQS